MSRCKCMPRIVAERDFDTEIQRTARRTHGMFRNWQKYKRGMLIKPTGK
ncbi:Protein of unknown function [Pyronema omphalodes CBS 100304]|uniref:Uncharacterized protein n=1 Tax=Pyronema omphalodes (strain CBS 100304) TaxID=1076935 RepID=U4L1D6_PYROM|nr:Protein of unknown function [Pyronema omphalodes CBS 100304]